MSLFGLDGPYVGASGNARGSLRNSGAMLESIRAEEIAMLLRRQRRLMHEVRRLNIAASLLTIVSTSAAIGLAAQLFW